MLRKFLLPKLVFKRFLSDSDCAKRLLLKLLFELVLGLGTFTGTFLLITKYFNCIGIEIVLSIHHCETLRPIPISHRLVNQSSHFTLKLACLHISLCTIIHHNLVTFIVLGGRSLHCGGIRSLRSVLLICI